MHAGRRRSHCRTARRSKSFDTVHRRALCRFEAPEVAVEVHLANGLPSFTLVTLADTEKGIASGPAAVQTSELEFPHDKRVTVDLAPADPLKDSAVAPRSRTCRELSFCRGKAPRKRRSWADRACAAPTICSTSCACSCPAMPPRPSLSAQTRGGRARRAAILPYLRDVKGPGGGEARARDRGHRELSLLMAGPPGTGRGAPGVPRIAKAAPMRCWLAGEALDEYCRLDAEASRFLQSAATRLGWSAACGFHRLLRVVRTIADLAGSGDIASAHVAEAIQLRRALKTR